jgi:hypothetical protein
MTDEEIVREDIGEGKRQKLERDTQYCICAIKRLICEVEAIDQGAAMDLMKAQVKLEKLKKEKSGVL